MAPVTADQLSVREVVVTKKPLAGAVFVAQPGTVGGDVRRPAVGRPGERIGPRPARSGLLRLDAPIATPNGGGVATTD